jgi:hypothetical protein
MNIPNIPLCPIATQDGNVSNEWMSFFNLMINNFQSILSNAGYKMPEQNQDTIDTVLNKSDNKAAFVYNKDTKSMHVNTDKKYKPLSTYEELSQEDFNAIPENERNGRIIFNTNDQKTYIGVNKEFKQLL